MNDSSLSNLSSPSIFIPTNLIFDRVLPPNMLRTWAMLRALAPDSDETPPVSMDGIASLTGKHPSTLYAHLAALRDRGHLSWRPVERGKLIVSFPELPSDPSEAEMADSLFLENLSEDSESDNSESDRSEDDSENLECLSENSEPEDIGAESSDNDSENPDFVSQKSDKDSENLESLSQNPESEDSVPESSDSGILEKTPSLKSSINNKDSNLEELRGDAFQNPGITSQFSGKDTGQDTGKSFQKSRPNSGTAAQLYRALTRISPNPTQRAGIAAVVDDLHLWQSTLEHWLTHGWNPRNLPGILELYSRGGPSGCRFCGSTPASSSKPNPLEQTLSALDEIRKEYFND